jgi:hypothetical protein
MARVASFEFYDDPVAHTGNSTCTINWTAQTVTFLASTVSFAYVEQLADVIDLLAGQDVTDFEVDVTRTIYKPDGTVAVIVTAIPNVIDGSITSIVVGATYSKAKAKDLAQGLRDFVVIAL